MDDPSKDDGREMLSSPAVAPLPRLVWRAPGPFIPRGGLLGSSVHRVWVDAEEWVRLRCEVPLMDEELPWLREPDTGYYWVPDWLATVVAAGRSAAMLGVLVNDGDFSRFVHRVARDPELRRLASAVGRTTTSAVDAYFVLSGDGA